MEQDGRGLGPRHVGVSDRNTSLIKPLSPDQGRLLLANVGHLQCSTTIR